MVEKRPAPTKAAAAVKDVFSRIDRLKIAKRAGGISRQVVGWSMGARIDRELALYAFLMAVYRRRPQAEVLVHSDQGSQFSSYDWQDFLKAH